MAIYPQCSLRYVEKLIVDVRAKVLALSVKRNEGLGVTTVGILMRT